MKRTVEIVLFVLAIIVAAMATEAWLASREQQRQLQSTLATQKQIIDAADARERSRDSALQTTLDQINALKRAKQTSQQILADLPNYLNLPEPITLGSAPTAKQESATQPDSRNSSAPAVPATKSHKRVLVKVADKLRKGIAASKISLRPNTSPTASAIPKVDPNSPHASALPSAPIAANDSNANPVIADCPPNLRSDASAAESPQGAGNTGIAGSAPSTKNNVGSFEPSVRVIPKNSKNKIAPYQDVSASAPTTPPASPPTIYCGEQATPASSSQPSERRANPIQPSATKADCPHDSTSALTLDSANPKASMQKDNVGATRAAPSPAPNSEATHPRILDSRKAADCDQPGGSASALQSSGVQPVRAPDNANCPQNLYGQPAFESEVEVNRGDNDIGDSQASPPTDLNNKIATTFGFSAAARAADCNQKGTSVSYAHHGPSAAIDRNQGWPSVLQAQHGAGKPSMAAQGVQLPVTDLKPLYNYVQDCRACQAKLSAAEQNSADDAAKIAALTRERDAAVAASKGGSFLTRLRHNALWFALGTTVGAAAGSVLAARR